MLFTSELIILKTIENISSFNISTFQIVTWVFETTENFIISVSSCLLANFFLHCYKMQVNAAYLYVYDD